MHKFSRFYHIQQILNILNTGWQYLHGDLKKMREQDQGSKAPSSHTSFYLCLPFYQVYLSILSFAPCTFLPSWQYIIA